MLSDREIKKEFKQKAQKEPEGYFAVSVLKEEGFARRKCKRCGTYFWSIKERDFCGDAACCGGYSFIGKSPAKNRLDYIEVWKEFSSLFKKLGYTPIPRYPVVARWNPTSEFVQAGICDFQPYVVSGEVEPPANPVVEPQFCLRFNDTDNVGITGAHYTGFVMIGQHAFMPKNEFDEEKYFRDIHLWLKKGLGLGNDDIVFHEDAWAGGGNFGPCMEFFSSGLELGNQVYMLYEQTAKSYKELKLKVLDMGMGHERNAWFTQGNSASYETTFPNVCKKLHLITGIKVNNDLMQRFLPYASYLNVDEADNINKTWDFVAKKLSIETKQLKDEIVPLSALYSVAEHSRALLVALSDGALPSNVGGGYNLRVILRRALEFIDRFGWKISLSELCKMHADYLKPLFPELSKNLDEVNEILDVEKRKYEATKQKSRQMVVKLMKENTQKSKISGVPETKGFREIDEKTLLQLYDTHGISPEIIKEEAEKTGKIVVVPDNFYAMVSAMHEKKEQMHATEKEREIELGDVPETKALYLDDYEKTENKAKVLKIIGNNVVLDETVAYPTSGGQLHDTGFIDDNKMVDVFKQGNVIVHVLENKPKFKQNATVTIKINKERRKQIAQHHTATHIVNAAARAVLGMHINQAGAKKTEEKAHLDITHYESVSDDKLKEIEKEANRIVAKSIPVKSFFMLRNEAEKKYGFGIYQGGAVPGKKLRIVEIKDIDAECCGGTHLKNTAEAGEIKLIKSTKISDSIVRLTFVAGKAVESVGSFERGIVEEAAKLLGVKAEQIPARASELFEKWKKAKKAVKKGVKISAEELELKEKKKFTGDILTETAKILQTQPEHIAKTVKRFLEELEEFKKRLE